MSNNLAAMDDIDPMGYFRALAKTMPEIVIIVDPASFKVQFINHVRSGLSSSEIIGADVFDFVYPEHIHAYRKVLDEVIQLGEARSIELETEYRSSERGKTWYSCTISPVKSRSGKIESLIVISKDITAQKLFDIEIHNKQEKIYAIINNTKDMIMSIDKDFNITEYNTVLANLVKLGYGVDKLTKTSVLNYMDPKKHEHVKGIYSRVFKGEAITDVESFETALGGVVYNETSYHPIKNFDQEIIGITIFSKDITERVLSEQKLLNTLKDREVLLAEIHHRIKNNLALVSSMLHLKEMNLDNELAKEALKDSRKRIKSTALVHEMLYKNDSFDNLKLLEYLPELFNHVNVNANIKLDLKGDDYVLDLNKALPFGLMLHELMMNSFKHSFKGRELSILKIRSKLSDEHLAIEYCDCSGVFPDSVDFYDTSTTGLMLVHTFAEQLNATIELVSKEPPAYAITIPLK